MKRNIIIAVSAIILTATPVFSQELEDIKLEDIKNKVEKFTDKMIQALPFNSAIGLNWSDAYVGQFPRFGAGVSIGATTMNFDSVVDLLNVFNIDTPFNVNETIRKIGMPLPGYTIDGRIGGFVLPFDIGIKAGFIPQDMLSNIFDDFNIGMKHMLVGADVRYCLINKKVLPINISVGLGVNYLDGGFNASLPTASSFSFSNPVTSDVYTITASDTNAGLEWRTISTELKTQISFPMKIITPYAGAGVSYAFSTAGYRLKSEIEIKENGTIINPEDVAELFKEYVGITDISDSGFESIKNFHGLSARAFGGASINLLVIRIDITAMYEFLSGNFGATFGLRVQL
ncbi:MAG: hypothetical protein FWC19_07285 [Treponema sp.]|nr:hypothetical protein [Treponema sp.]MCL2272584.1 hypothetical protein [Treponema sp.]